MKKLPGIYIIYPQSRLIYDGKKDLIVKTRKIDKYLDTPIHLVDGRFCYGVIKFSFAKEGGVKDFKELFSRHKISDTDLKRWWPKAEKFYFYKVEILEKFPHPKNWDYNEKVKSYVQEVNFIKQRRFEDITSNDIVKWLTKELIITSLKLTKAYDGTKDITDKDKLVSHYLILWEELRKRDINQDKSTTIYKESKKLGDKLKDYGFDVGDFLDTFQKTGLNAIFTKGGMKIKKRKISRRMKMYSNIDFKFYPQIINRTEDEEGNWYVEGYAATSDPVDDKNSPYPVIIPNEELDRAAKDLIGTTVFLNHRTTEHIGKVASIIRKGKKLWVKVLISKTVPTIWKQIQEGVLNSFSINGKAKKVIDKFDEKLGKMVRLVCDFVWKETSVVGLPADRGAKTLCWQVARALDDMKGQSIVEETIEKVTAFTRERMKLKDILPEVAEKVAHKYNKHADNLELIIKGYAVSRSNLIEEERAVISYISTGAQDRYNEILDPNGVILDEYLKNPVVLWGHNSRELPIGRCEWIKQDDKGLIAKTLYANTPEADKVYNYRKDGFPVAQSVGFIPLEWIDHNEDASGGHEIFGPPPESGKMQILKRTYTKWLLLEYSDVPVPANPECLPIVVLGMDRLDLQLKDMETKGVIPYSVHGDGPKAPEDTPWNAGEEVKKATGNAKKLKKMHTWVDSGADNYDPDERQWYKLPHHKGDGTQAVVWRGVANAAARLPQTNIPAKDKKGCQTHLGKHYKQFDKEPPWEKSPEDWERYCEVCEALGEFGVEVYTRNKLTIQERDDLYKKLFSEEVTKMEKKEEKKETLEVKEEPKEEVKGEKIEEKKEEPKKEKVEEKEEVKALTAEEIGKLIDEKLSAFKAELLKELKPEEKKEEKVEEKKEEKTEIKRSTGIVPEEKEEKKEKPESIPYSPMNMKLVLEKKFSV